jgi:hypothetical protein
LARRGVRKISKRNIVQDIACPRVTISLFSEDMLAMRRLSRIGGALYVTIIALGFCEASLIRERLIVSGNPALTAENLRSMATLWRLGIASDFVVLGFSTVLAIILYRLLSPVNPLLAAVAVFFNLVTCAVEAVADLMLVAAILPVGRASYLAAFTPEQRYAVTYLAMVEYDYGFGAALIFFGFECLILGYLIYRSDYLPKVVGGLMFAAGTCYLINSFARIAAPAVAARLFPAILLPPLVGESSLALWLLFKGVDDSRFPVQLKGARGVFAGALSIPSGEPR